MEPQKDTETAEAIKQLQAQGMTERDAIYEAYRRKGQKAREKAQSGVVDIKTPAQPVASQPAPAPAKKAPAKKKQTEY